MVPSDTNGPVTDGQRALADSGEAKRIVLPTTEIAVEAIRIPTHGRLSNARRYINPDSIKALAENDIAVRGLLAPIVVRELANGEYELVAGRRRLEAVKHLGWETVTARIGNELEHTPGSYLAAHIVENTDREPLRDAELAEKVELFFKDPDLTVEEAAGFLGLSVHKIRSLRKLIALPAEVRKRIARGELDDKSGHRLARISRQSPASAPVVLEIASRIASGAVSGRDFTTDPEDALRALAYEETKPDGVFIFHSSGENISLDQVTADIETVRQRELDTLPGATKKETRESAASRVTAVRNLRSRVSQYPPPARVRRMSIEDQTLAEGSRAQVAPGDEGRAKFVIDPEFAFDWAERQLAEIEAEGHDTVQEKSGDVEDERAGKEEALERLRFAAQVGEANRANHEQIVNTLAGDRALPRELVIADIGGRLDAHEVRLLAQGMRLCAPTWQHRNVRFDSRSGAKVEEVVPLELASTKGDEPTAIERLNTWLAEASTGDELYRRYLTAWYLGRTADQHALAESKQIRPKSLPVADEQSGTLMGKARGALWSYVSRRAPEWIGEQLRATLAPQDDDRPDPLAGKAQLR